MAAVAVSLCLHFYPTRPEYEKKVARCSGSGSGSGSGRCDTDRTLDATNGSVVCVSLNMETGTALAIGGI